MLCGYDIKDLIPVLSLLVALLAVFVGPIISSRIARRQVSASLATANKQIIAPMRQAWINTLRDLVAELTSRALHYYVSGFEDRTDEEYQQLTLLEQKICLMLNPAEEDHRELEQLMRMMIGSLQSGKDKYADFPEAHKDTGSLARKIFKREWNRIKDEIKIT